MILARTQRANIVGLLAENTTVQTTKKKKDVSVQDFLSSMPLIRVPDVWGPVSALSTKLVLVLCFENSLLIHQFLPEVQEITI